MRHNQQNTYLYARHTTIERKRKDSSFKAQEYIEHLSLSGRADDNKWYTCINILLIYHPQTFLTADRSRGGDPCRSHSFSLPARMTTKGYYSHLGTPINSPCTSGHKELFILFCYTSFKRTSCETFYTVPLSFSYSPFLAL